MTTTYAPAPSTAKQIAYIESLMTTRKNGAQYVGTQLGSHGIDSLEALTKSQASNLIGVLVNEPQVKIEKDPNNPMIKPGQGIAEGIYRAVSGGIWRIKKSQAGNLYAQELVTTVIGTCGGCERCDGEDVCTKSKGTWVFRSGAMKQAKEWTLLTLEQAAQFGKETGVCCCCGRTLTNPDSIAAGIGPICAGGF